LQLGAQSTPNLMVHSGFKYFANGIGSTGLAVAFLTNTLDYDDL
jgi:hypothetical protein